MRKGRDETGRVSEDPPKRLRDISRYIIITIYDLLTSDNMKTAGHKGEGSFSKWLPKSLKEFQKHFHLRKR